MATISDVAKVAGVSVATVSHVINQSRPVRPETRRRVLAAVHELAYKRDGVARSLRRAKTGTIGVLISDITNPFFAEIVLGIEAAMQAAEDPHTLILCNTEESEEKERLYLDMLQEKRVDGVIAAPAARNGPAFRRLIAAGLPLVFVDRMLEDVACDAVVLNNRDAARRIVEHLLARGHQSIAMLRAAQWTDAMDAREAGWREALQAAGLQPQRPAVAESRVATAKECALRLLEIEPRPDAVFTTNNFMTLGLIQAMAERGLRCPEDLAIAGFDDVPWADGFQPSLTVVRQPGERMGREAGELLLHRMGVGQDGAPTRRVFLGDLLIRKSCGGSRRPVIRRAAS